MKISTSKGRGSEKQSTAPEPYQHPKAIKGHVYMITRSPISRQKGQRYYAVLDSAVGKVRLYNLDSGVVWSNENTFGVFRESQWVDITDKVYLNTDGLEDQK